MIREMIVTLVAVSGAVVISLYLLINGYYLLVHLASVFELHDELRDRSSDPAYTSFDSPFLPGIAAIIPAYNEEETIVNSTRSLLDQTYPNTTVIVVNDGSTDATFETLRSRYDLEFVHEKAPWELPCEPIRGVYRSRSVDDLLVVDKENGGKADALNAAIHLTDRSLFCSIDADSILDREGLRQAAAPFVANPTETVAVGGSVRIANGCEIAGGQILDVEMSDLALVRLQEIEYLRAFYSGRLGLSRLRSLLVISGTFGLFRTDVVREIDGYSTETVTEDLDLVVRLHKHLLESDRPYTVDFVPEPIVWTQVPETLSDLARQRRRWYRGLLEAAVEHRKMIANPRYGTLGTLAFPIYLLAEGIGPLVEGYGYVVVPLAFLFGILNAEFFGLFLAVIIGIGVFLSWFGVFSEVWSYRRYDRPGQIVALLGNAIVENFGYRQWKAIVAWHGLVDFLRDDTRWGEIERQDFEEHPTEQTADQNSETPEANLD